jgi:tetratricopeptide (TPR) repeat protein
MCHNGGSKREGVMMQTARAFTFVMAAGLFLPLGFGQGRGGATSPPASGGGAAGGSPSTTSIPTNPSTTTGRTPTTTIPNTQQQQQQPQIVQPIFVSGRVLLEDGTPPPEFATMETVCNGQPHAEGYTDSKGYFSLELGRRAGVLQDASESSNDVGFGGGMGDMGFPGGVRTNSGSAGPATMRMNSDLRLMNCELRARLAGYRSQVVSLATRRPMDSPELGLILLHRLAEGEGSVVSANSLAAPKAARKAFTKGTDALKKKKAEDAAKSFQKALELYPQYASAWYEMGRLQLAKGDKQTARQSFEQAVKADPKYVLPLVDLATLSLQDQDWPAVVEMTDRAAKLDSFDYPQIFLFNAVANYNLRNFEAAEKSARQADRLDTRHQFPKSSQLLGIILSLRRDYTAAAEQYRNYLKFAPGASDAANVRSQLEQFEKASARNAESKEDK